MKALNNILSGHSADELDKLFVSDPHYAEFLKYVNWRKNCEMGRTTWGFIDYNLGTLFEYASKYSVCEQFFAIGFTHKQIAEDFRYSINKVPKWLRNYCLGVKNKRLLNNKFVDFYKKYPDYVQTILQTQYMTVSQSDLMFFFANRNTDYYMDILTSLNKDYGYNLADVFVYMDKIMTFEAIVAINWLLTELRDYARMMDAISHKFDRYPRHFKTTIDIVTRNYKRLKKEFSEEVFKKRINKEYEFTYKGLRFFYPNCTQDIKDEAVQQNNCVASYIDRVIDGECHIMFLRRVKEPDKSLVTIEIQNGRIVQALQRFNDPLTADQQEAVDAWNEHFSKKGKVAA